MSYSSDNSQPKSSWDYGSGSTQSTSDSFNSFPSSSNSFQGFSQPPSSFSNYPNPSYQTSNPNDSFSSYQQPPYQTSSPQNDSLQGLRGLGGPITLQNNQQSVDGNQPSSQSPKQQPLRRIKIMPFDDFIKNKTGAFLYFSRHPDTEQQFERTDVDAVSGMFNKYNKAVSTVYFGTCVLAFLGDELLRRKNIIYGMTYRTSILKILTKFWIIPTAMTSFATWTVIDNMYIPKMDQIAQKYSFSDPLFKAAYEKEDTTPKLRENEKKLQEANEQRKQDFSSLNVRQ